MKKIEIAITVTADEAITVVTVDGKEEARVREVLSGECESTTTTKTLEDQIKDEDLAEELDQHLRYLGHGLLQLIAGRTMSDDDMYDLANEICAKSRPLSDIEQLIPHVSEDDMMSVSPFDGDMDDAGAMPLSDKMVTGRKEYRCHMMRTPIAVGERHRCLRERSTDGEIVTYRFSVPALVLAHFGEDPTVLKEGDEK